MKRTVGYLSLLVTLCVLFTGCGSASAKSTGLNDYSQTAMAEAAYDGDYDYYSDDLYMEDVEEPEADRGIESVENSEVENSARKIIRTVNIDAETEEFDKCVASISAKVQSLGGYMENTSITGRSVNEADSMRYANITARVPAKNLDSFVSSVSENSNILNKSESANDVTLSYADTEAHINSLRTEQKRLDELLLQAEDIETIIAIEQRITDVRYELESYESRLRTMENQVVYSTINMNIREVRRYKPVEEKNPSIGKRIVTGFTENLIEAKEMFVNLFVSLVVSIPIIIFLVVIIGIPALLIYLLVVFIIGRVKGPDYRAQRKIKKAEKKANRKKKAKTVPAAKASVKNVSKPKNVSASKPQNTGAVKPQNEGTSVEMTKTEENSNKPNENK